VRTVVVDANVLVSFFVDRIARQRDAADELLQSQYGIAGERLASVIRDVVTTPGVQTIDTCPWRRVFELWANPLAALADASIIAVATTHRYDAIATFDQKLAKRAKDLGVTSYW